MEVMCTAACWLTAWGSDRYTSAAHPLGSFAGCRGSFAPLPEGQVGRVRRDSPRGQSRRPLPAGLWPGLAVAPSVVTLAWLSRLLDLYRGSARRPAGAVAVGRPNRGSGRLRRGSSSLAGGGGAELRPLVACRGHERGCAGGRSDRVAYARLGAVRNGMSTAAFTGTCGSGSALTPR